MEAVNGNENPLYNKAPSVKIRAIEDSDAAFINQDIESDPLNHVLAIPTLLVPATMQSSIRMTGMLAKSLLAVIICLQPAPDTTTFKDAESSNTLQFSPTKPRNAQVATPYVQQLREDPTPIGYLCINLGEHTLPFNLKQHGNARLGISIAARFQKRRYGSEAVKWPIDWAFRFARMHSVRVESVGYNHRAHALHPKAGIQG